jgi:hypothetical protein
MTRAYGGDPVRAAVVTARGRAGGPVTTAGVTGRGSVVAW